MFILRRCLVLPLALFAWLCIGSVAWPQSFETLFQRACLRCRKPAGPRRGGGRL